MSEQPWEHLVSISEVLEIHAECISRFGGDKTETPKDGCLEGSLGAAWNAELYSGSEEAIQGLCFAGCVLFYLIKNHCFVDGNKRVAWASCMEALRSLGLTVNATDEQAEEFCMEIIAGNVVKKAVDVSLWLTSRLEAIPEETQ